MRRRAVFANNIVMGKFVSNFVSSLRQKHTTGNDPNTSLLFVSKPVESGAKSDVESSPIPCCCVIDQSVYSRNRTFRLLGSSKLHKDATLKIAQHNRFPFIDHHDLFMQSLICNVPLDLEQCAVLPPGADSTGSANRLAEDSVSVPISGLRQSPRTIPMKRCAGRLSPCPEIDEFIKTQINTGGVPGFIRSWYMDKDDSTIVYNIGGNRFCHNIGRAHKSNHIQMVVDLHRGVYYQQCLDMQCRNFRSEVWELPPQLADIARAAIVSEHSLSEDDEWISQAFDEWLSRSSAAGK